MRLNFHDWMPFLTPVLTCFHKTTKSLDMLIENYKYHFYKSWRFCLQLALTRQETQTCFHSKLQTSNTIQMNSEAVVYNQHTHHYLHLTSSFHADVGWTVWQVWKVRTKQVCTVRFPIFDVWRPFLCGSFSNSDFGKYLLKVKESRYQKYSFVLFHLCYVLGDLSFDRKSQASFHFLPPINMM